VLKDAAGEELLEAIRSAMRDQTYLTPAIAGTIVEGSLTGRRRRMGAAGPLGAREREVLQLLAEGQTSKEIADRLGISAMTVEVHRRNIMRKLDLHSVAELTKYAIREGLTQA
jgi:two-component system NarL family response regulator